MVTPSEDELREFCNSLDEELAYFKVTFERVLNAVWIIPEYRDQKLVALTGIEKKYGIVRSWTIVKKEYWRKGIGSKLFARRLEKLRKDRTCHVLLAIVHQKNTASIKNATKQGYKFVGKRGDLLYGFRAVSSIGPAMIFLIRIMFPLARIVDRFRT